MIILLRVVKKTEKMCERYNSNNLFEYEKPFKRFFDQLEKEFGAKYEIFSCLKDYGRFVVAGVLDRSLGEHGLAMNIYMDNKSKSIPEKAIQRTRSYFDSDPKKDGQIIVEKL